MMKILFVINSLISGGAEKLLSQLLPLIKEKGHKPSLLLLDDKNDRYSEIIESHNISVSVVPSNKRCPLSKISYIKKFIKEGKYDVVHANLFPTFYYVALAKVFSRKKEFPKLYLTEHSVSNKRRKSVFYKPIEKFIYKRYDRKISISQSVNDSLVSWLKEKKRIGTHVVIENGVDINVINQTKPLSRKEITPSLKDNDKLLCMVGSFTKQKNHLFLLDVLSKLPTNYHLILLGEGSLKEKLIEKISELDLEDRVHFMGYQANPYQYMKSSDVIVMPSLYEGFGLVAVEALACNKPLIYSKLPALETIVGEAGISTLLDIDEFVHHVIDVCNKDNKEMILKTNEVAKKYDINITMGKYIEEFLK